MSQQKSAVPVPELLSPAGSMESLRAAVQAGADAVYFGGAIANARANAKNFSDDELETAVKLLHANNRRAYITLNTLHTDRELISLTLLKFIEHCCKCGADAFILQDIGLSSLIKRFFPDIKLHASTQMAGHSSNATKELAELGFSRMVMARELDSENLKTAINNSPIEIEMFVHGALCSSHSGRCFMSFALGNTRSANRGMCAQPCRLNYNNKFLLSLKDLCLAQHIKELIELSPASLKIEGRMKPPEYVYHVTKIYRRCLDERRNAEKKEIELLSRVFSRQGFTGGYFMGNLGSHMYGVRTKFDKAQSKTIGVQESYEALSIDSANALKEIERDDKSESGREQEKTVADIQELIHEINNFTPRKKNISVKPKLCLNFDTFEQFSSASGFLLKDEIYNKIYRIFIPATELNDRIKSDGIKSVKSIDKNLLKLIGIRLPYVVFDGEESCINDAIENITGSIGGAVPALIDNIGHIKIAEQYGLEPFGNFGLNITNSHSLREVENMGFKSAVLSPELNFAQIRDIAKTINCGIIVYGKTHVMVSENCLIRNSGLCGADIKNYGKIKCASFLSSSFSIEDRLGEKFVVTGDFGHRNIIFNSVPVYLADKKSLYKNLGLFFVILNFTDEKKERIENIIGDYAYDRENIKPPQKFTRGYK